MKKRNHFTLLAIMFATSMLICQNRHLKKADKLYDAKCYALAIPHYHKGLASDSGNVTSVARLGDCYRLTNNINGQLKTYGKLVNTGSASELQKLYYAEALTASGRANEARQYFKQFTSDERGKKRASLAELNKYSKDADAYEVKRSKFNSPEGDFGAIIQGNDVYFLSSRKRTAWVRHSQGWTKESPVAVYFVKGNDTVPEMVKIPDMKKLNAGPFTFISDTSVIITRNYQPSKDEAATLKLYTGSYSKGNMNNLRMASFCLDNFNYVHPSISADGNTLFFASDREGGKGGMDLYYSVKNATGWSAPVNMGEKVNTAGNELFPFVTANNLLYFSSNGHEGMGGLDVYETRLKDLKPSKVYNLGMPVNSREDDFSYFLNKDGKTGFFSTNRDHSGLDDDIYQLNILREVKRGKEVLFVVKDRGTGAIVPGSYIQTGTDSVSVNDKGEFLTMVDEDKTLNVQVRHADYFLLKDSVRASESSEDRIVKILNIEKDPKLSLKATILDLKTMQPLEGVKMTLREMPSNQLFDTYTTSGDGLYRKPLPGKKLGDKIAYAISLEKEGYVTKKTMFIYDIKAPGEISMNDSLNLAIGKIEVGMDVGKMIDLKPIYFDLGKSSIRKDAAAELDKMVVIMKEYPNMSIELGSHTDCRAAAAANMKLSSARAKSSADYIVKKGIERSRITGKGYGETKLLNSCACEGKTKSTCSEEEHAKNRRTEFIITRLK
jgi:outer membrane protein OmpA-like peptidoglycan-associated protein